MDAAARALNRAHWDELARVHGQDAYYDTASLVRGASSLTDVETEAIQAVTNDVAGLRICHVQCHIGFDSVTLARLGARVTGLDFSAASLAKCADLAQRCGVDIHLVEADACDPPGELAGSFDLVYATIGVLCWIDDVDRWMSAVHGLLRPGGHLILVELHPIYLMIDRTDPLVMDFPYAFDGAHRFDQDGSYADPDAHVASTATVQYAHGVGEVVSAAVTAGLSVIDLRERTDSPRNYRGDLGREDPDGRYRVRLGGQPIPLLYTLVAQRRA